MFWRKKPKEQAEDPFHLSFEEGPREAFRVTPDPGRPVRFKFAGQIYPVEDISAGGLALKTTSMAPGSSMAGILLMPEPMAAIPCVLVVIKLLGPGLAACRFGKIRPEDQEQIHLYVLNRQKEELAQSRVQPREEEP